MPGSLPLAAAKTLNAMRSVEDIFREVEGVPDFVSHHIDSVSCRNGYGDTALHIVSLWGDCEAIDILVSAGADINAPGENGFTPLHYAAQMDKPEAVLLLRRLGANADVLAEGDTALDVARAVGSEAAAGALTERI